MQNGTELKEQRTELLKKGDQKWAYTVKNSNTEESMDDSNIPQAFRARKWLEINLPLNKAKTHAKDRSAYKEEQQSKIFYLH